MKLLYGQQRESIGCRIFSLEID